MKKTGLILSFVFFVLTLSGCAITMGRPQSPLIIDFKQPEITFWGNPNPYPYWYGYYPNTYVVQKTLIYRNYGNYRPRHYPRHRR